MSKMTEAAAWVTVMSNLNTLAVASLSDVACVVLAEGVAVEETMLQKAVQQEITVLRTELPIFDAALKIQKTKVELDTLLVIITVVHYSMTLLVILMILIENLASKLLRMK